MAHAVIDTGTGINTTQLTMDDLLTTVSELFVISDIPNNTAAPHPHFSNVKTRKPCNQEKRRKLLLEEQKRQRAETFNQSRHLDEEDFTFDSNQSASKRSFAETSGFEEVSSEDGQTKKSRIQQKRTKHLRYNQQTEREFKNMLMLSEWLVDVPKDMANEWYILPCPEGKRATVATVRHGKATAFSKQGKSILGPFDCVLPKFTILDCVWSAVNSTFYVLDVIQWNSLLVENCETDFRFTWLKSKFEEIVGLPSDNRIGFILAPYYSCTSESLSEVMSRFPMYERNVPRLDGLLFYHIRTHYTAGHTPLVGWLKPYMVPSMLGVEVAEEYKSEKLSLPSRKKKQAQDAKHYKSERQKQQPCMCDDMDIGKDRNTAASKMTEDLLVMDNDVEEAACNKMTEDLPVIGIDVEEAACN